MSFCRLMGGSGSVFGISFCSFQSANFTLVSGMGFGQRCLIVSLRQSHFPLFSWCRALEFRLFFSSNKCFKGWERRCFAIGAPQRTTWAHRKVEVVFLSSRIFSFGDELVSKRHTTLIDHSFCRSFYQTQGLLGKCLKP